MKISILIAFTFIFLASSCSKEIRFNKKIEGKWEVVTRNGQGLGTDYAFFEFMPIKGEGTYKYKANIGNYWYFDSGKYTLSKDEFIFLTSETTFETKKYTLIKEYEKRNNLVGIILFSDDSNGISYELNKM